MSAPGAAPLTSVIGCAGHAVGSQPKLIPVPLKPVVGLMRIFEARVPAPGLKSEQIARLAEYKDIDIAPARADPASILDRSRTETQG